MDMDIDTYLDIDTHTHVSLSLTLSLPPSLSPPSLSIRYLHSFFIISPSNIGPAMGYKQIKPTSNLRGARTPVAPDFDATCDRAGTDPMWTRKAVSTLPIPSWASLLGLIHGRKRSALDVFFFKCFLLCLMGVSQNWWNLIIHQWILLASAS